MKIVLCCLLLASLFFPRQSIDESAPSFRVIPIPAREHGYYTFKSIVIRSQKDLDSFLTDNRSRRGGWKKKRAFEDALINAKLDFSKEALVLLRHTENSWSVHVAFETPVLRDRTLHCEINGKLIPPGYGGTGDMAYYCYALAVSKAHVSKVELQAVQGGFSARRLAPIILPIADK